MKTAILWATLTFPNGMDGEAACRTLGISLLQADTLEADDETTTVVGDFEVPASWWPDDTEELRIVRAGVAFEAYAA